MEKDITQLTGKELESLLTNVGKRAIQETHAAGQPTTHGDGDRIYRLHPDGRKEYL